MKYTSTHFKKVMTAFLAVKDFDVKDYKSFALIRLVKNGKYSIKLMYGYDKNRKPIYGKAYVIDGLKMAFTIIEILEQFQKVDTENETNMTLDDLLDDTIPIQQAQDKPQPIVIDEPMVIPETVQPIPKTSFGKPTNAFFKTNTQGIKSKKLAKDIEDKRKYIKRLELNDFGATTKEHIEATAELHKLLGEI